MKIGSTLFEKGKSKHKWIYLVGFVPWILIAIIGAEYGAFWFYVIPAILCLVQYFFPTILLWGVCFFLYLVPIIYYLNYLLADIYRLLVGIRPTAMVNYVDSLVFITFEIVLLLVTYFIFLSRPKNSSHESNNAT